MTNEEREAAVAAAVAGTGAGVGVGALLPTAPPAQTIAPAAALPPATPAPTPAPAAPAAAAPAAPTATGTVLTMPTSDTVNTVAAEIAELCTIARRPDLLTGLIGDPTMTVAKARKALVDAQATPEATQIGGNFGSPSTNVFAAVGQRADQLVQQSLTTGRRLTKAEAQSRVLASDNALYLMYDDERNNQIMQARQSRAGRQAHMRLIANQCEQLGLSRGGF